jgi:hypothetical protein
MSGTWTLAVVAGGSSIPGTLTLRQEGARLSGTLESAFGKTELTDGSASAEGFRFTASAVVEGRTVEISVAGTVNGNQISGTVTSEIGATTFTGTRPQKQ